MDEGATTEVGGITTEVGGTTTEVGGTTTEVGGTTTVVGGTTTAAQENIGAAIVIITTTTTTTTTGEETAVAIITITAGEIEVMITTTTAGETEVGVATMTAVGTDPLAGNAIIITQGRIMADMQGIIVIELYPNLHLINILNSVSATRSPDQSASFDFHMLSLANRIWLEIIRHDTIGSALSRQ